jgi:hypothetical protein
MKTTFIRLRYKTLIKHNSDIFTVQSVVDDYVQVQSCIEPLSIKKLNINEVEVLF